jgi:AcrR family transcriptional regulator
MTTRERILDAAVRRIAREGADEVRIASVAMDAGVSAALVHYHFATRDALLQEAIEHSYEMAGDAHAGSVEDPALSAHERLRNAIDQCLPAPGALRDDWFLWVELWLRAGRNPEQRATASRLYGRLHEWLAPVVAEAGAADPPEVTDRLLALIDGYGVRALTGDPAMPLERARAQIWAAIAPALAPEPAHDPTA